MIKIPAIKLMFYILVLIVWSSFIYTISNIYVGISVGIWTGIIIFLIEQIVVKDNLFKDIIKNLILFIIRTIGLGIIYYFLY